MKNNMYSLACAMLFFSVTFVAQSKVDASTIMEAIKAGKDISYKNAMISGTLDFTFMEEAMEKLPKKKKRSWWGMNNNSNSIENMIEVAVSFVNCTFEDDVLAYIPNEDSGYTFTASFAERAVFKNSKFLGKAMFKYSDFEEHSDFSGSTFEDDTTFKYAKFKEDADFSKTIFTESATFKYANFWNFAPFTSAVFEDSATFKYTKFNDGVSFKDVVFEEDLNIKYMTVNGEFDIRNMKVGYDIDAKYTKINGKSFSKALIDN